MSFLSSRVFENSVYVVLLLNLCKNLNPSSFLFSSKDGSYATYSDSTGNVLKVIVDILKPFLCMLSSIFSLLGKAVLYSWQPKSLFYLYIALYSFFRVLLSPPYFFPDPILIVFNALFAFTLTLSIYSSYFNLHLG